MGYTETKSGEGFYLADANDPYTDHPDFACFLDYANMGENLLSQYIAKAIVVGLRVHGNGEKYIEAIENGGDEDRSHSIVLEQVDGTYVTIDFTLTRSIVDEAAHND
jgi:hypothetical protein